MTQSDWGLGPSVSGPKEFGVWVHSCTNPRGLGHSVFEPKKVGVWVLRWSNPKGLGSSVSGSRGLSMFVFVPKRGWARWGPKGVGGWVRV